MVDVSVVISARNEQGNLERVAQTLCRPHSLEIIVIDNNSTDETVSVLSKQYPHIRVIANSCNNGVGPARLQGVRRASGRYFLFLDADTEPSENLLDTLLSYADQRPSIGIVGPRLIFPTGERQPSCRRFQTPATFLVRGTGVGNGLPFMKRHMMQDTDVSGPLAVDWVIGACQLIRREAYEDAGGLDAHYFYGYEDVDLCYRMWRQGWEVHYVPHTTVVHHYQRKGTKMFGKAQREHIKSAARFFAKKYGLHSSSSKERLGRPRHSAHEQ